VLNWCNWLIGAYIFEFEQTGEDRADYGEKILQKLAVRLKRSGIPGLSLTNLKGFRKIALTWPLLPIGQTLCDLFEEWSGQGMFLSLRRANQQSQTGESKGVQISQTPSDLSKLPELTHSLMASPGGAFPRQIQEAKLFGRR
jgi:hypothetical protein